MGGACSRKRDQQVSEDSLHRGVSGRYSKSASSKWLGSSFSRGADAKQGKGKCPSLMELCIHRVCEDIDKYSTFSVLPRDISQQIFDELVCSQRLTDVSLEAFRDCALQDLNMGEYPGLDDNWMDVISSQGSSLLSLDLSGSDVTDPGLTNLKDCKNLQALNLNYCDQITDCGLENISGLTNLTSVSFRRNNTVTAQGMSVLSGLINLVKLDLERCPKIHGGMVHLKGLAKLESLNINCCNCITDSDMKPLADLTNLKGLQISSSKVTDYGVIFLKALEKLTLLNMEGCPVTAACLESLSGIVSTKLNCIEEIASVEYQLRPGNSNYYVFYKSYQCLQSLKVLNLGFNDITDAILVHLRGDLVFVYFFHLAGTFPASSVSTVGRLSYLESLNLDSCRIRDEGLIYLSGLHRLKSLELSDTEVGNNGIRHLSGLRNLESLNLSFTVVTDSGLKKLCGLSSLRSLNLDARQITDTGLAALTSLTGLTHLDLFGAKITDSGTSYLRYLNFITSNHLNSDYDFSGQLNLLIDFKNLRSLEICGGGLTDAGVKNIKDLTSLTLLNLSQNSHLTDKSLEVISGLTQLVSLNVSNSRVTNMGLQHLKQLKNLKSLTLESCKVTANDIRKLQSTELPNLVNYRPE
uniref:F-box domain-containing protein n=1 Tax=Solanum lycopersicum TaxID=4081 RepID=A0A3Q7FUZ9_SOLLC